MKFLEHDIQDKIFLRYINRFLISGYMEDMKYYCASLAAYKKSLKKLENDLKEILYQFNEVYIIENIYMYSKKKLIKIK